MSGRNVALMFLVAGAIGLTYTIWSILTGTVKMRYDTYTLRDGWPYLLIYGLCSAGIIVVAIIGIRRGDLGED